MTKPALSKVIILVAVAAGIVFAARFPASGGSRGQEDRPKFYASRVISEQGVKNGSEALGEPDGRCAEIAPGGQIVLLMKERIFPSTATDDGLVITKGDANYGMEGWFLVAGTKDAPQYAWMPLVRGMSEGGFRLTSPEGIGGTAEGSPGVNMIRISNDDTKPILLDAVAGYGRPPRP